MVWGNMDKECDTYTPEKMQKQDQSRGIFTTNQHTTAPGQAQVKGVPFRQRVAPRLGPADITGAFQSN